MNASDDSASSLIRQLEARERRGRVISWLFILIPVLVVGVLLWFSASQLSQMDSQLQEKKNELASYGTTLETTKNQLAAANQQVGQVQQQLDTSQQQVDTTQKQLVQTQTDLTQAEKNEEALKQQIADTSKSLSDLQQKYSGLQKQYDDLQKEYDQLVNSMRDVRGFAYVGDPLETAKELANKYPLQSDLFETMLYKMSKVPWKRGGVSPQEGFDSPGFAAYMLESYKLISQPAADAHYRLHDLLKQGREPRIGDLVFYELGYTMFYYKDSQGRPFVVGMTPLGVLALRYDFAKVIGFGQVDYAP